MVEIYGPSISTEERSALVLKREVGTVSNKLSYTAHSKIWHTIHMYTYVWCACMHNKTFATSKKPSWKVSDRGLDFHKIIARLGNAEAEHQLRSGKCVAYGITGNVLHAWRGTVTSLDSEAEQITACKCTKGQMA